MPTDRGSVSTPAIVGVIGLLIGCGTTLATIGAGHGARDQRLQAVEHAIETGKAFEIERGRESVGLRDRLGRLEVNQENLDRKLEEVRVDVKSLVRAAGTREDR